MRFKSKIGVWFHLAVLLILSACALPIVLGIKYGFVTSNIVLAVIFNAIVLPFILSVYFYTCYTLEETTLHIRSGIISIRINYKDITAVYETKDPSGSFGLSFDRISINTAKSEWLISPKNKQEFLKLLSERMV